MKRPELTVIIPLLNEAETLPELWRRLKEALSALDLSYEVIFVDDGSTDGSSANIADICRRHPQVRLISLSRTFGHQAALAAGMDHASGNAVVVVDGDLQDRPEVLPDFVDQWKKGYDVVYAVRAARKEGIAKRLAFRAFYWLLRRLSGVPQPLNAGAFCLLDRKVLEAVQNMPEHNRYFPGLRAYAGFKQVGIEVARDSRYAGPSRVGLAGLIKLACDAIFSFSYIPIRVVSLIGLSVAFFAFLYILVIAYKKFISHEAILGWASTLGAVLFIGGLQLLMLGIVAEYIGRIYEETKQRPQYIVAELLNFDTSLKSKKRKG